ncbi:MAG TPA: glutaminyl-peptide cyclotransferase [Caldilineaceae bacterium]|nr:glutaminyl-peptide cyclotransferase [Caldilineaceae bacterium]
MNTPGRTRWLVGGVALTAIALVVAFFLSQQTPAEPAIIAVTPADQTETPVAADSPLAAAQSPLALPAQATSPLPAPVAQRAAAGTAGAPDGERRPVDESLTPTATANLSLPMVISDIAPFSHTAPVEDGPVDDTPVYTFEIVAEYPHDPEAFTQGLQYVDGFLYEGTGLQGASSLRRVALETGEVLQQIDLAEEYFGEGIVVVGDRIYQLTWLSNVGFIYDRESFELLDRFSYPTQGWGITYDGTHLIMSDGSYVLRRWDPETLEEVGRVEVVDALGNYIANLNELEYINGDVYANIWQSDRIARIDPETGQVTGWIDLTGLLSPEDAAGRVDVLNGIAYDAEEDRLFVTGKWWPKLFEIDLIPVE